MNHSPRLTVLLQALEERQIADGNEAACIEVYGGVTFRDLGTRLEEDALGGSTMFTRRLQIEPIPNFCSYRFKELCFPVDAAEIDGEVEPNRLWYGLPHLWDVERILIACLGQVS
jgi:hypothetical protein